MEMAMPSWFTQLLTRAQSAPGVDFTFAAIPEDKGGIAVRRIVVDEEYVLVKVRAANIVDVRRWTGKFHACVHARTTYFHDQRGAVEFQTILLPEMMKGLDPTHLDRVIQIDSDVVGPIPYRGKMSLELGLFSVKGGDLAGPYLDLLTGVAGIAGSYVQQAVTYVEPLRKGFDLLFGNTDQAELEIGVDTTWADVSTGTWLLMRAPAGPAAMQGITIDAGTGHLLKNGNSFRDYPYVVLQIEAAERRDDWQSPELKEAWNAIRDAAMDGDDDKATKAANRLQTTARWSPDLVRSDAKRLYDKARKLLASDDEPVRRLGPTMEPRAGERRLSASKLAALGDLGALDLYDVDRQN